MLAVQPATLQALNVTVLIAGAVCALGWVVWLFHSGRWQNPLAGVEIPPRGPSALAVAVVILAYLGLDFLSLGLIRQSQAGAELRQPGSHAWYLVQVGDAVARTVACVLMVVLLGRASSAARPRLHMSVLRGLTAGVLGLLIFVPLATVQLQMGRIIWSWLYPAAAPPVHPVLLALSSNAWGTWGVVQLLAVALVVAPVAEELFFRGLLLGALCRYTGRGWVSIVVSAVAFGCVHGQPQDILPLVTMGVLLGYLRLRGGTLWPCMVLHALFNARTMTFAILAPELLNGP